MKRFLFGLAAAMVVTLVWGTGVGFAARGINAAHYYEDTVSNVCVGLEEAGGFGNKSCHWGELAGQTFTENTGIGERVLEGDETGSKDVAAGYEALAEDKTGGDDTATGWNACLHISSGSLDTCTGLSAALRDTSGKENTADGVSALFTNKTGSGDIGIGVDALENMNSGANDIAIGNKAANALKENAKESNDVDIANVGVAGDEGVIRIGTESTQKHTYIAGIWEKEIAAPTCTVLVNSSGELGCIDPPHGASSNAPSAVLAQLHHESVQVSRQQQEIDQLAGELQSLREQIDTHR